MTGTQFAFDPQPHSADRTYTFTLRGQNNETVSVWAYAHDVYADGALMQTEPGAARDLRFITRYRLTVPGAFNLLQTQSAAMLPARDGTVRFAFARSASAARA